MSLPDFPPQDFQRAHTQFIPEGMISPTEELGEFHLDMNLDDMEGIVDPTLANAPPQAAPTSISTSSSNTAGTNVSSFGMGDPRSQSIATTLSSGGSSGSNGPPAVRQVISEADRPGYEFGKRNPFSDSPTSSVDGRLSLSVNSPPSPQNMSPKHTLMAHPGFQPRRPSQLRNVKLGSQDGPDGMDPTLQPLAPAWATSAQPGQTVFNDPFGSLSNRPRTADGISPSSGAGSNADRLAALKAQDAAAAAWAAPESWGVEGDDEEGEATSSSEEDEAEWNGPDGVPDDEKRDSLPTSPRRAPPPFGHGSRGTGRPATGGGKRPRTGQGRASTSSRPRDRPGTSGSAHAATVPVSDE